MPLAALFSSYTQSTRLLRLTTPLGANTLLAESVHGAEGLSSGFCFTITALSLDAHLSLRSLIGQPALLELLTSDNTCRPFHGHLTMVEQSGANGGLARYTLTLTPWTAFLAHNRDSRVFQFKTVRDILDAVFTGWKGQVRLSPSWRFELFDPYPQRSLCTQYQESDWAFAERLMRETGLFYWFDHTADQHELVIADHNSAFKPNRQPTMRFTQSGAVMREDGIDRWRSTSRLLTNAVDLSSWDYRTHGSSQVTASVYPSEIAMRSRDAPGQYAYPDQEHGQRLADRQLDAFDTRRKTFTGAGTVRTCAPGTTFALAGHPVHDDTFLVTRVVHAMRNNLHADLQARVIACLGPVDDAPIYRNRFDAVLATVRYRSSCELHPRPTVRGQQTAIVVGPGDAVVHTDRDNRVKVQYHWQREIGRQKSHSRLTHPVAIGHSGAPANDSSGTWVRVATAMAPIAGANWGAVAVPRVGQEVVVDFIGGNIDRPVLIGAVYNSIGRPDAPHSKGHYGAGVATGNAPAWFPGARDGNAHAAVLSGFKSQAMATSQWGSGAYSQLVFDDTAGQARVSLQRHAKAHQGTDELNLGYLRHQSDNQRLQTVGLGAELKTENSLAMRAGQGLLLSSDAPARAQMEVRAAHAPVEASRELQESLARTAQAHKEGIKRKDGGAEVAPAELPALAQMKHSADVLDSVDHDVAAWSDPQLQLSSPAGIVAATPVNAVFAAGNTTSVSAGQAVNFVAQGSSAQVVRAGISMFTYGKGGDKNGIALHAASGKVSSQSQSGATRLTADKAVAVASINKSVSVAAKTHVLLTAQGAALNIEGGNITLSCPGQIDFKASAKELAEPKSSTPTLPHLPSAVDRSNFVELNYRWDDLQPMVGAPYKVRFDDGTSIEGKLDAKGFARLDGMPAKGAVVTFGEDERDATLRHPRAANALLGARAVDEDDATALIATYLAQEDAHYQDNYFPDEIEAMADGESMLDYDFHYDDYQYANEQSAVEFSEEKSYRAVHDADEEPT